VTNIVGLEDIAERSLVELEERRAPVRLAHKVDDLDRLGGLPGRAEASCKARRQPTAGDGTGSSVCLPPCLGGTPRCRHREGRC
jgi:hypothetical protein